MEEVEFGLEPISFCKRAFLPSADIIQFHPKRIEIWFAIAAVQIKLWYKLMSQIFLVVVSFISGGRCPKRFEIQQKCF